GQALPWRCLRKASSRRTYPYGWRSLRGWWRHYRVLILHDQPSRAALDQDERAYVLFVHVPYAVGAGERAHATGHGRHRRILVRKTHIQLFDIVRYTAQKRAMHFMQLLEHLGAPVSPAAIGIDVVPVLGGEIIGMAEPVGVEGGVERLDRLAHGRLGIGRLRGHHGGHGQHGKGDDERFHGFSFSESDAGNLASSLTRVSRPCLATFPTVLNNAAPRLPG